MSVADGAPPGAPMIVETVETQLQNGGENSSTQKSGIGAYPSQQTKNTQHQTIYQYQRTDEGPFRVIVEREIKENDRFKGINKINNFVMIKGVINGIPEHLSEENILANLECSIKVVEVFRMTRRKDGEKLPTSSVGTSFRGTKLPAEVKLYLASVKVNAYVYKVVICQQCLRYGHIAVNCKGKRRCDNCGGDHEEKYCGQETKCVNCSGNHRATDESYAEALKKKKAAEVGVSTAKRAKKKNKKATKQRKEDEQSEEEEDEIEQEMQTRKRKATEYNNQNQETDESMSVKRYLELRNRWEEKLKEIVQQRENYKHMASETFKNLSTALSRNDD
ncbi:uncharacterized protein LOC129716821 [Wyeomyia smithii]|uniref:uncharacterized protein LOC129716821 n=1 Tax=Wyeomyia smithii TaxID=174621 RepID=UPI0024680D2D|nr:uncharacterized protein LOC129716821 [Wyeomyia smithii]